MAGTFTKLLYHAVYSTKHREPLIVPSLRDRLYEYIGGIIRGEGGVLLEIGGTPDHIHWVARLKTEPSVAVMLKTVKAKSSKWVNEQTDHQGKFAWQRGYGAFTVSVSQLPKVNRYVRSQEEHHRVKAFKEEFIGLLEKHGIEYDERYVWD
ncbi:MAG: IS200/IS605 family transposase [Planctomycetes bacterium]|nr:IS200/IS605 family transposase [Planctomycetota bacterium]MBL7040372.1 IS200/IS605 family transposase [Pirellulaceae bacterium]